MRVGFFTDTYLPVSNGICYVIEIIRKDLEAAGHEVYVFAPRAIGQRLEKEIRIKRYPAIRGSFIFYEDQFNSLFWPTMELNKVRELKLDVIVAFTPTYIGSFGAYCSRKLNIPYVIQYGTDLEGYAKSYKATVVGGVLGSSLLTPFFLGLGLKGTLNFYKGFFVKQNFCVRATRQMLRPLHEQASVVIATSDKIAKKLKKWPVNQSVATIPTGVDSLPSSRHMTRKFMRNYGLSAEDEIILYAGRMSIEKNIDRLIDAFSLIANKNHKAKLLLVGDFQYKKRLEVRAAKIKHGDRVIFTGLVGRGVLGSIYPIAKVFAFPSLTDCQALVLNEAAHAGVPLVWCDSSDLNPILRDAVSGLRAKNNAKDLSLKILELLQDEALRQKLGTQAKKMAREYSEARQSKKIEAVLKNAIKNY